VTCLNCWSWGNFVDDDAFLVDEADHAILDDVFSFDFFFVDYDLDNVNGHAFSYCPLSSEASSVLSSFDWDSSS